MKPTRARTLRLILGWTLAILAAAAMWMSYGALYETARAVGGMPHERAVVFPIVIDVVTIAAMLIALLGGKAGQWVAWTVLLVFGALTVLGNAAHVVTVDTSQLAMGVTVGIVVNSVPGVALLMVTHLAAVTVFGATAEAATAEPATDPVPTVPEVEWAATPVLTAVPSAPTAPSENRARRGKWTDEQRAEVLALAGRLTIPEIVERTGIPRSTVGRWITA
jgi:hypothetical protein